MSEEYTKDKNKVYYKWISNGRFWIVELPLADAKNFEVIDSNLAKDKNQVLVYGEPLPGVDPKTVEIVNADLFGRMPRAFVSENKDFQRRCKDVPAP